MRPVPVRLASLVLAGLAVLLPTSAHARDADAPMGDPGALPRLEVRGDAALELPLRHTDVKAEITGFVARVEVTQVFANAQPKPIEAVYVFPLPEHSAVEGFTLVAGDRRIEAQVKKRDDARRTYEDARTQGKTAALLEQERPNVFTQSVANLPPGEEIRVTIRFSELLSYDAGEYEFAFPMVVGPRYVPGAPIATRQGTGTLPDTTRVPDASRISPPALPQGTRGGHDVAISVDLRAGRAIDELETPSHDVVKERIDGGHYALHLADHDTIPNRDFVLRFRTRTPAPAATVLAHRADGQGAFALVLQPPQLDVESLVGKREVVFVVDVSGSMWGLPLWLCQEAMRDALMRLRPDDTFNLITFSGSTGQVFAQPQRATPENVATAMSYVDRMTAGGGTEMLDAISAALKPQVEPGRRRYVFFLTDGWVGNDAQLIGATHDYVQALSEHREIGRVFSFGVGSAPNKALLDGIARSGNGASVYATNREDPRRGVDAFFRRIDHPIIEDVSIDWGGLAVADLTPQVTPDLFLSKPLVVLGRYRAGGEATIHVRGHTGDGQVVDLPFAVKLPEREDSGAVLTTLWARAQVEELSDAIAFDRFHGVGEGSRKERITELGLEYHLATAYTSFVAVDNSRTVGDGHPTQVTQPIETPEDTDARMARGDEGKMGMRSTQRSSGAAAASQGTLSVLGPGGMGGDLGNSLGGLVGAGQGGGGYGLGGLGTAGVSGHGAIHIGGKAKEKPLIEPGEVVVQGDLDREAIKQLFARHQSELAYCYRKALSHDPSLEGRLVVVVTLAADGKVLAIEIKNSTLASPEVESCVSGRVQRWSFPPTRGGKVQISYPLVFAPAS